MTSKPIDHELIPTGHAARALGVSTTWVKVLIDRGDLSAIRVAGRYLIDPGSLDQLIASRAIARAEGKR